VESQFVNSTRKLVDSDEEQEVLEELIDGIKPPVPAALEPLRLHYLLATPFRHPPLRNGSRFGRRWERGIFYGAREPETCFAEVAYYRFVFLSGTRAALPLITTVHTAFQAGVRTARGVDLTRPPFSAHRSRISSKTDYSASQQLGTDMRADGVTAALFTSARAIAGGTNVALLDPAAFSAPHPFNMQEWLCTLDPLKVELKRKNLLAPQTLTFPRTDFLVRGELPAPAAS
jgi:hypothetical protein